MMVEWILPTVVAAAAGLGAGLIVAESGLFSFLRQWAYDKYGAHSLSYEVVECPVCLGCWAFVYTHELNAAIVGIAGVADFARWAVFLGVGIYLVHLLYEPIRLRESA